MVLTQTRELFQGPLFLTVAVVSKLYGQANTGELRLGVHKHFRDKEALLVEVAVLARDAWNRNPGSA